MENLRHAINGQMRILEMINDSGFSLLDKELSTKAIVNQCLAMLRFAESIGIVAADFRDQWPQLEG